MTAQNCPHNSHYFLHLLYAPRI
uniref:Uncharacterized protein n=1 Tax=Arundo donax TaxID=35708 RepID=A0A0A9EBW7_ARUDO